MQRRIPIFSFQASGALQVHLAMAALLNASMIMEDPFATDSLDGVYCDEILFDAEKVCFQRASSPMSHHCCYIMLNASSV